MLSTVRTFTLFPVHSSSEQRELFADGRERVVATIDGDVNPPYGNIFSPSRFTIGW